jgi:hypothetical protein
MSNVLIGIIGVILFIGLALAGALFLGPRFQEARISARAAAEMQAVSQMANAVALFRVQEGEEYDRSKMSRLYPSYLKATPANADRSNGADYNDDNDFTFLNLGLEGGVELNMKVCKAIQKQVTGSEDVPKVDALYEVGRQGCKQTSDGKYFMVYQRV